MDHAAVIPNNGFLWMGLLFRDDENGTQPGRNDGLILPPPDGITSDQFAAFMAAQVQT